jgi:hypothetical protein
MLSGDIGGNESVGGVGQLTPFADVVAYSNFSFSGSRIDLPIQADYESLNLAISRTNKIK